MSAAQEAIKLFVYVWIVKEKKFKVIPPKEANPVLPSVTDT